MFDSEFVGIIIKYKDVWCDSASYKLHVNYVHGLTLLVSSEEIQILQSRDMSNYSNVELLSANEKELWLVVSSSSFFGNVMCFSKKAPVQYGSTLCVEITQYTSAYGSYDIHVLPIVIISHFQLS